MTTTSSSRGSDRSTSSVVYPGVVKGWHYHRKQTDHFVFVKGMAKVVLYDSRETSPTRGEVNEYFMGEQNPILLVIPPFVLHGMKGIGVEPAYLVNTPTEHYVYDRARRVPVSTRTARTCPTTGGARMVDATAGGASRRPRAAGGRSSERTPPARRLPDPGHGRRGLHRLQLRPSLPRALPRRSRRRARRADLRRAPREPRRHPGALAHVHPRRHPRARGGRARDGGLRLTCSTSPPSRTSTARSSTRASSSRPTSTACSCCARRRGGGR